MQVCPTLTLGLANQWILFVVYALCFLFSVFRLPQAGRAWLFTDPKKKIHGPG